MGLKKTRKKYKSLCYGGKWWKYYKEKKLKKNRIEEINKKMIYKPIKQETTAVGMNQRLFKFDNGFGASVIIGENSYGGKEGLFEIAVIKWTDNDEYELTYDTNVTDDVMGYLTETEVQETLKHIEDLTEEQ